MIIDATPLDATQFTAQYELLRSQVIGAAGDAPQRELGAQPRGVGLALLLREGMPGWLNAIDAVIRASLVAAEHRTFRRRPSTPPTAASRRRGCPVCNARTLPLS